MQREILVWGGWRGILHAARKSTLETRGLLISVISHLIFLGPT